MKNTTLISISLLICLFFGVTVCNGLTLNITSPEEDGIFYIDVVPAYLTFHGVVDAPEGIQNISITNGQKTFFIERFFVPFNNTNYEFTYDFPYFNEFNQITVTAFDLTGDSVSETRNFTAYAGIPPEGTITVSGFVVDNTGAPVPNTSVLFETVRNGKTVVVETVSGADGKYKMTKARGLDQRVTIQKEGYPTTSTVITFKPYKNEANLTFWSYPKTSGFGIIGVIVAIFGVIFYKGRGKLL